MGIEVKFNDGETASTQYLSIWNTYQFETNNSQDEPRWT